jgi:hydroxymethylglutaryl-CoA reductase (NADPH)
MAAVVAGKIPSYVLESRLGDCRRAVGIRREALRRITRRDMDGLPLDGFDYAHPGPMLRAAGRVRAASRGRRRTAPAQRAPPLRIDGHHRGLPRRQHEQRMQGHCRVRWCLQRHFQGRDDASPVVRFLSACRAAELKAFLEDPANFDTLAVVFNR